MLQARHLVITNIVNDANSPVVLYMESNYIRNVHHEEYSNYNSPFS